MKLYIVLPDMHVPFHCQRSLKFVYKLVKELNPDGIVELGDAIDAFQISFYDKDPARKSSLIEDITSYKQILNLLTRDLKSGAHFHQLTGNHEARLARYIARNCREIHGLVPDWRELFGIDIRNKASRHKWFLHDYMKWKSCQIGDVILHHGFYYNQHAAATMLQKYKGYNMICGHTHRVAYINDGKNYAAMLGHLSNEHETAHSPTMTHWTKSIGLLHVATSGKTNLDIVVIDDVNWKAVVYGKTISL